MKKNECQMYLEELSKYIKKSKNKYAQGMSKALKYKWDNYSFVCGNEKISIKISISLLKGDE